MSKLISLCMIVKNEEKTLERALDNLDGFYDELIIVDTGSEDRTLEIAQDFGAILPHYKWEAPGNKGAARNAGIDVAEGKWCVILDADEIIAQPTELREFLSESDAHGIHVQFHNFDAQGAVSLVWNQMRIFKNGAYRYKYREHETPVPALENLSEVTVDAVFEHRPEVREGKQSAMLERLKLDVQEHPEDPHPLYFLHRQYMLMGKYDNAIQMGKLYLRKADDHHDRCECYGNLAICHAELGETKVAAEYYHRALVEQPNRRIWWIKLGELYHNAELQNIALAYLRAASELWPAPQQHYQPGLDSGYLYDLMQHCQLAIANGGHSHGE